MYSLSDLLSLQPKGDVAAKVLSVYLGETPGNGAAGYRAVLEQAMDGVAVSLPADERRLFARERAAVMDAPLDAKAWRKGLAVFSSQPEHLWWLTETHVPLPTSVRYETAPYLGPLISAREAHRRYCLAAGDTANARLFLVRLGEVEAREDVQDRVPRRHSQNEHAANIERQHGAKRQLHMKHVAEVIGAWHKEMPFDDLVIGGAVEAMAHFERELPPHLTAIIAGRSPMPMYGPEVQLLARAEASVAAKRAWREEQAVARVLTQSAKHKGGVSTEDATLLALKDGEAHELIAAAGHRVRGCQCTACGLLSATIVRVCARCGAAVELTEDVVERALAQAAARGTRIMLAHGAAGQRLTTEAGGLSAVLESPRR